jgi:hypothetical protein
MQQSAYRGRARGFEHGHVLAPGYGKHTDAVCCEPGRRRAGFLDNTEVMHAAPNLLAPPRSLLRTHRVGPRQSAVIDC